MKRKLIATILLSTVLASTSVLPAHAQFFGGGIVFDPTNYSQNLLTAARELQQVNNEIVQLQNEATMLQDMGKNLSSLNVSQLSSMVQALSTIGNLMNTGSGIAFNVNATNAAWSSSFPASFPLGSTTSLLAPAAQTRWGQAMAAFQQALQVQAQIVQSVQADSSALSNLVNASQGAIGNLQVTQATNQLLALSTKQQLQLQSLEAAQYRATALDSARAAETEAAAQVEFTTFMGTNTAYTPQ
jgi:type IV secretion system protein TrbJ